MNACETANCAGACTGERIAALLEQQLREMRLIRVALQRRNTTPGESKTAVLAAISALMGSREWTCDDLFVDLAQGDTIEDAQLRAALHDLAIDDARTFGNMLRSVYGVAHEGYQLCRHNLNRNGARRWSVIRC